MKNTIIFFILLMVLQSTALNAQDNETKPRFTEFCTEAELLNRNWQCKISETDTINNYIIQLVSSQDESDYYDQWICLQILDKITGVFVQELDLSDYYHSSNTGIISTGDYNFDGYEDFSLWGGFGTLDNSFSYYFLFDPSTNTFSESDFGGTNLDFHSDTKTITSRNRCCAGTEELHMTFKLQDNRMILLEQHSLTAVRDKTTGDVILDDEGDLIFEETDHGLPYYLDIQLESVGLKNPFQFRMAVYDEDMAGGFVQYAGKTERIAIHFDRLEKMPDAKRLYYNEIYNNNVNGVYSFTLKETAVENLSYIRGKDGKIFNLKISDIYSLMPGN